MTQSSTPLTPQLTQDELRIIALLQDNGRTPFREMGRILGMSEPTVRRTVHRLLEQRTIAITAVANPRLLGLEAMAWVFLRIDWGRADRLQDALLEIPGVDYVATTSGRFQVMAEIGARNQRDLAGRIELIRAIPGVRSTETLLYIDIFHQEYRWMGPGADEPPRKVPPRDGQAISELGQQLIIALRRDGRRSFSQIGRDLGAQEHQVRAAYARLRDAGALRVMAVLNPAWLGIDVMAWVGIRVDPAVPTYEVAQTIAELSAVDYLVICAGRFDVMAELTCRSREELAATLERDLGAIAGVDDLEVFQYLRLQYRDESVWSAGRVSALE